jgi:NAD(P)-dependent dehydrogenase (short-subunit alcohol dehydrogenase family)
MATSLDGRVLIITGGSSGIGRATAIEAARAGMDVVVTGRREDRLRTVVGEIERLGRRGLAVAGDVVDVGFSERLLDAGVSAFGRVDAVFANAGYGAERRTLDFTDEELRRMFEVNLFASVDLVRAAARRWRAAGQRGHLLLCSSCVAKFTLPGYGPYAATKAAQAMIARSMRYELRPHGIEVSSVHPVTTATEFFEVATGAAGAAGGAATPSVAAHAPKFIVQPPERVARAVIACLRRPRSEVWTSFPARLGAAFFTLLPGVADLFLAPHLKHLPPER